MELNKRELASGLVCVGIGLFFFLSSWLGLQMGTARAMGPGYFPSMAGALLIGLGVLIAITGVRTTAPAFGVVAWRGLVMILVVPVLFAVLVRGLGLIGTLIVCCFVAAFASRRMSLRYAAIMAPLLALLCWFVFVYLLDIQIQLIGPWVENAPVISRLIGMAW